MRPSAIALRIPLQFRVSGLPIMPDANSNGI
jgi:hypothetical protein